MDLCLVEPDRLSGAAAHQLHVFRTTDQRVLPWNEIPPPGAGEGYDAVVDAVLVYSLQGAPRGNAEEAVLWMRDARIPVVSLDLPSGVEADTGDTPGVFVTAEVTLTLHLPKPGLDNPAAGELWLADLGIPSAVSRRAGVKADGMLAPPPSTPPGSTAEALPSRRLETDASRTGRPDPSGAFRETLWRGR